MTARSDKHRVSLLVATTPVLYVSEQSGCRFCDIFSSPIRLRRVRGAASIDELVAKFAKPRAAWVNAPAGVDRKVGVTAAASQDNRSTLAVQHKEQ